MSIDSTADGVQFRSAAAGSSIMTFQPLTLCPGSQYRFEARSRQANVLADCGVEYALVRPGVERKRIIAVEPQEDWTGKDNYFTAGSAEEELWVTVVCRGWQGMSVTDVDGYMKVDVQGVSVVRDV